MSIILDLWCGIFLVMLTLFSLTAVGFAIRMLRELWLAIPDTITAIFWFARVAAAIGAIYVTGHYLRPIIDGWFA